MPPLDNAQMMAWWTSRAKEVAEGVREIIIQLTPKASALQDEVEVVGMVMLATPFAQTGSFRGYVEKLCVRDDWRGKGIAGNLMKELDTVALERGRPLMVRKSASQEGEKANTNVRCWILKEDLRPS